MTMTRPGPKIGYKQTQEHIEKRKRLGVNHPNWKGHNVSDKGGRARALRAYPQMPPCVQCGNPKSERHHKDGNTSNNNLENIIPLCRPCHMKEDGRLESFRSLGINNLPKANKAAAVRRKAKTCCPKGHPYSGSNLYINPKGARVCRQCINDYKRSMRGCR